jgi:ferrous iron transport protein A
VIAREFPSENLIPATIALAQLRRGEIGIVVSLADAANIDLGRRTNDSLLARLRDLGFVPGARCEVVARMWPGGCPLAVRIGGSTFALRRAEAVAIRITPLVATATGTETSLRGGASAVAA